MNPSAKQVVRIRPATMSDRRAVYEWMACSDVTPSMMGPPVFSEIPIPTWEQFCVDYVESYFDVGQNQIEGRSFVIEVDRLPVGHISYSRVESLPDCMELDIWMRSSAQCGRGFGPRAIDLICRQLAHMPDVRRFILRPSARNKRAVAAYEKAGFERIAMSQEEQTRTFGEGEFRDTMTLERRLS